MVKNVLYDAERVWKRKLQMLFCKCVFCVTQRKVCFNTNVTSDVIATTERDSENRSKKKGEDTLSLVLNEKDLIKLVTPFSVNHKQSLPYMSIFSKFQFFF